jgi:hypothetical protein
MARTLDSSPAKSRKRFYKSSRVGTPTETAVFTGSERDRTDRSPFNPESIGMFDKSEVKLEYVATI